jgi:AraC-like DNA-binding protein
LPRIAPVTQVFSSDRLPADLRYEAFRARINSMFDMEPLDRADEADFSGEIRSVNLGSLLASTMRTRPFAFARTRSRLLRDFIDHVMIRVDLDRAPCEGGRVLGLVVIDLGRVSEGGVTPPHNVSVVVPRRLLGLADADLLRLHGQSLATPMAMVLADHLVSVTRHADGLGAAGADVIGALTPALLAACLEPSREATERARADLEIAILARARAHIEAHLRLPGLGPDAVARAAGVSRATLYRLFEHVGGVARVIREARLKQAMRDILERGASARIGDIGHALCFSSEAQFSRAFKAHFGFTPREARAAVVAGRNAPALAAGAPDPDRLVFGGWLSSL